MARFREAICYTRKGVERCTHHSAISYWLESSGWTRVGEEKPVADKPEPLPKSWSKSALTLTTMTLSRATMWPTWTR